MATINLHADFTRTRGSFPWGSIWEQRKRRSVAIGLSSPTKLQHYSQQSEENANIAENQDVPHLQLAPIPRIRSYQLPELQLDKLQKREQDDRKHKRSFGKFVAWEAMHDQEYWGAAWLRAENQYEDQSSFRFVKSYIRKYAEQEYHGLKRRCAAGQVCIITVKQQAGTDRVSWNSIVGTLDLSMHHLLPGESFPRKRRTQNVNTSSAEIYGYIANLCVTKCARRQGIATNMLYLAIEAAKGSGAGQVQIHVDSNNKHAQELYKKIGFQIVERDTSYLSTGHQHLMHLDSDIIKSMKTLMQDT